MGQEVGKVQRLWRYPVKSLLGEQCSQMRIDKRGAWGDRLYTVRDENAKFGSGKTTRLFTKIDGLFKLSSYYREEQPIVVFPDGTELAAPSVELDGRLSLELGKQVTVEREGDISHFDDCPIHIISTSGLLALKNALPEIAIDERRFRPNLVLNTVGRGPVENEWIGKQLQIGNELILEIIQKTERCGMVTFAQGNLPREPHVLKHLSQEYDLCFGVYAHIIQTGNIAVHDQVKLL
ncbi:MOSC domain-containing protein [Bacillus horti]|uniref:Uncharacterized protein YcbX n=1 Tax=Caldalkalibacillus horti TaxID=77523 RepID=A0ABT9VWZ6_9BACI|nr:MOSC domain-containing protein [Bacillus horti]MDQ0165332.1 uncharacterized protein YcbX [Bacillus horti]